MKLAIFDLDNTLIAGVSDCLWGEFLSEQGYVESKSYRRQHEKFYRDYLDGALDIDAFLAFQLKVLGEHDRATLESWRRRYMREKIEPILLSKAMALVTQHRQQQHELMIITSTNRFLTEPIAIMFDIGNLIACEAEMIDGEYTGRAIGSTPFAEGKVTCLGEWLEDNDKLLCESWFYSDSHTDIPLLQEVDHAIAVDPDDLLAEEAKKNNWSVISLRD